MAAHALARAVGRVFVVQGRTRASVRRGSRPGSAAGAAAPPRRPAARARSRKAAGKSRRGARRARTVTAPARKDRRQQAGRHQPVEQQVEHQGALVGDVRLAGHQAGAVQQQVGDRHQEKGSQIDRRQKRPAQAAMRQSGVAATPSPASALLRVARRPMVWLDRYSRRPRSRAVIFGSAGRAARPAARRASAAARSASARACHSRRPSRRPARPC